MRTITKKSVLSLMLILALLAASIAGCKLQETEIIGAPKIPPESTFIMDFNDFNAEAETASAAVNPGMSVQLADFTFGSDDLYSSGQYALGDQSNWNWAAGNVGVWSALILIGSAVPIAAFLASFYNTPQQLDDYTWEWQYNVLIQYSAKLHGKFIDDYNGTDDGVRWEMYISKQGGYTDFLWYYGESNLPATEGFWILMDNPTSNPTNDTELIRIDWARDLAEGTYSIQYTNIVPGGNENGGYIYFGVTTDEPYDRSYNIYNKGAANHTEIEWSSTTKEGRVKDSKRFLDSNWHCWNSNYQNTDCST